MTNNTPSGKPTDAEATEWLAAIANQDKRAYELFYKAFHTSVYRYAMSRLNDSFVAADILHEVMLEVWRSAGRFEGRSKPSTWLLGIAHHKTVDWIRKETRRPTEELEEEPLDDDAISSADAIASMQDSQRLTDCMSKLPDSQREAVHLAFFEDMSYPEIASTANCPEGTVKTRVFHGKRALKKCLSRL